MAHSSGSRSRPRTAGLVAENDLGPKAGYNALPMHCSYKAKNSCLKTAGWVLACMPPLTILAQRVQVWGGGRCQVESGYPPTFAPSLRPLLRGRWGGGGQGVRSCATPSLPLLAPGAGEVGRKGGH